eukprot:GHVL01005161.1.p1 GENE.GHVL01005161.1~~GHVL01005161.1.p1  ORF type:complete len:817 (-),score=162.48 GHVL01005161.1:42-2492(-)
MFPTVNADIDGVEIWHGPKRTRYAVYVIQVEECIESSETAQSSETAEKYETAESFETAEKYEMKGFTRWSVSHRYLDFYILHKNLCKCYEKNYNILPILPKKQIFFTLNRKFLENRKNDLCIYLKKLLIIPDILYNEYFTKFLCIPIYICKKIKNNTYIPIYKKKKNNIYYINSSENYSGSSSNASSDIDFENNILNILKKFTNNSLRKYGNLRYFQNILHEMVLSDFEIIFNEQAANLLLLGMYDGSWRGLVHESGNIQHSEVSSHLALSIVANLTRLEWSHNIASTNKYTFYTPSTNKYTFYTNLLSSLNSTILIEMNLASHINSGQTARRLDAFEILKIIGSSHELLSVLGKTDEGKNALKTYNCFQLAKFKSSPSRLARLRREGLSPLMFGGSSWGSNGSNVLGQHSSGQDRQLEQFRSLFTGRQNEQFTTIGKESFKIFVEKDGQFNKSLSQSSIGSDKSKDNLKSSRREGWISEKSRNSSKSGSSMEFISSDSLNTKMFNTSSKYVAIPSWFQETYKCDMSLVFETYHPEQVQSDQDNLTTSIPNQRYFVIRGSLLLDFPPHFIASFLADYREIIRPLLDNQENIPKEQISFVEEYFGARHWLVQLRDFQQLAYIPPPSSRSSSLDEIDTSGINTKLEYNEEISPLTNEVYNCNLESISCPRLHMRFQILKSIQSEGRGVYTMSIKSLPRGTLPEVIQSVADSTSDSLYAFSVPRREKLVELPQAVLTVITPNSETSSFVNFIITLDTDTINLISSDLLSESEAIFESLANAITLMQTAYIHKKIATLEVPLDSFAGFSTSSVSSTSFGV